MASALPEQAALFRAFVEAAQRYDAARYHQALAA